MLNDTAKSYKNSEKMSAVPSVIFYSFRTLQIRSFYKNQPNNKA